MQKILFDNGPRRKRTPEEIEEIRARQRAILDERIKKFDNRRVTIRQLTEKTPQSEIPEHAPLSGVGKYKEVFNEQTSEQKSAEATTQTSEGGNESEAAPPS